MRHRFPMDRGPFGGPGFRRELGGGYGVAHVIVTIAFIVVLVALAVWLITLIRRNTQGHHAAAMAGPRPMDNALTEARMRYARGEMSRDQYVQIAMDLG